MLTALCVSQHSHGDDAFARLRGPDLVHERLAVFQFVVPIKGGLGAGAATQALDVGHAHVLVALEVANLQGGQYVCVRQMLALSLMTHWFS